MKSSINTEHVGGGRITGGPRGGGGLGLPSCFNGPSSTIDF